MSAFGWLLNSASSRAVSSVSCAGRLPQRAAASSRSNALRIIG